MGSCAAPSAKGDDKFITTDYLQQCPHISDQYAPFSTRVVNVGVRDSTYVLDGLLYHESDLRIEEHYT
ncbi:Tn3 family transposase, partial [Escherichia coli]|nr:Tn3 family transposase [Escherichia coli]